MIFPEYFPASRDNEHAEKKVFAALKKVSDRFDIFYHKKVVAYHKIPCEIDFVIFDRRKSVLLMEVKGGRISYEKGVWMSNDNVIDPLDQIENSKKKFLDKYGLSEKIRVDFCLCFPDSDLDIFPDSILSYQIISNFHFNDLEAALRHTFKQSQENLNKSLKYIPPNVSENEYTAILRKIEGEIKYHIPLSKKVEGEDVRIKELTEEQYTIFECCIENSRIVINGVAGSGKTILAHKIAKEYYKIGANVLLLCYNIMLGKTFENEKMASFGSAKSTNTLTSNACHSFLQEIITDKNFYKTISSSSTIEARDEFYNIELPIKLEDEINTDTIKAEFYDILIIDEAQDFNEFTLAQLFRLVKKEGKIILLKDDKQTLYKQSFIPQIESFFKLRLNKNLRNTKAILRHINKVLKINLLINETNPQGEPVEEKVFSSNAALLDHMCRKITHLITKENIPPQDITILYPENISEQHCLFEITNVHNLNFKKLPDTLIKENDCI